MIKIKVKKWKFAGRIFNMTSGAVFIVWLFGMMIQFIRSVLHQNYSDLQLYGQIALTMFGFTLLGGIFEKNKNRYGKGKLTEIEKKLFDSSLLFLTTAISFFFMYALSSVFTDDMVPMAAIPTAIVVGAFCIAMFFGFYGLILGFINLYRVLIDYRASFDESE